MRRVGIKAIRLHATLPCCAVVAFGLLASCATQQQPATKAATAPETPQFPAARLQKAQTVRLQALTVNPMARVGRVTPIALTV